MNIVSMAMQYLTPMIIDKIAGSLGITSPLATKAIGAILPTILGGLIGSASKPDGIGALTKALGQQDAGLLGNLGSMIGGSGQSGMVDAGSKILGSLLGNSAMGSMAGAVSKFAGIGDAPTKTLMGMLAPVALGALAKEQKASNLDASGLAKMLMGQKDNVAAALPSGFADLLKGSGILDAVAPAMAPRAATTITPAATSTAARPASSYEAPKPVAKSSSMLPWLAGLALAALAGWYFLGGGQRPSFPVAPKITVANQDVGGQLGSVVEGLRGTLTTIRDESSAKAAVPRLQDMQKQLETINGLRGQLPAEGKKALGGYAGSLLPLLRPLIENALKGTAVAPIVKPILDRILGQIDGIAKG